MWATHPSNNDREENAKRVYAAAAPQQEQRLELFANLPKIREKMSAEVVKGIKDLLPAVSREESLGALNAQFEHRVLQRFYRGTYIGRSLTRQAKACRISTAIPTKARCWTCRSSIRKRSRVCSSSCAPSSRTSPRSRRSGRIARSSGRRHSPPRPTALRRDLRAAIVGSRPSASRYASRSSPTTACAGLRIARPPGARPGWEAYLVGLLQLIHYAEHTAADLRDQYLVFINAVAIETATRKVDKAGLARSWPRQASAGGRGEHLRPGSRRRADPRLAERLAQPMERAPGQLNLPSPTDENINDWLSHSGSWIEAVAERSST
jgi:hypothetical protein